MVTATQLQNLLELAQDKNIRFALKQGKLTTQAAPGAITPEIAANIKALKDDLIAYLQGATSSSLVMREVGSVHLCSPAQQQLWLHQESQADSGLYHLPILLRVRTALDMSLANQALTQVVARHVCLHSTYQFDGEQLQMQVQAPVDCEFVLLGDEQGSQKSAGERDARLQDFIQTPFDLTQQQPLRAGYWRVDDNHLILVMVFHHIAMDGWSLGVFEQEFASIYAQLLAADSPASHHATEALAPLNVDYVDYATAQRDFTNSQDYQNACQYWDAQLAELNCDDYLQRDYVSQEVEPSSSLYRENDALGETIDFALNAQTFVKLQLTLSAHGISLFEFMQGALALSLSHFANRDDITLIAPFSGRDDARFEHTIGHFVNLLPLRIQCLPTQSINEFWQGVHNTHLAATANQHVAYETLIRQVSQRQQAHFRSLSQVMLLVEHQPDFSATGLPVSHYNLPESTVKSDIMLQIMPQANAVKGQLVYLRSAFDKANMEAFVAHFQRVINDLVDETETASGANSSLMNIGHQEISSAITDSVLESARVEAITLDAGFKRQVREVPENIALSDPQQRLSYAQLNALSDALVVELHALGVCEGDRVGIEATRSINTVIRILALIKLGAVYVPLDAANPVQRTQYIVQNANVTCVLLASSASNFDGLPHTIKCVYVPIENVTTAKLAEAEQTQTQTQTVSTNPGKSAYIIYTSGSTGMPKGVEMSHAAVSGLVLGHNPSPLNSQTCCLQTAAMAFDAVIYEIWGCLLNGGQLHFTGEDVLSLEGINHALSSENINTLWLTSGLFTQWSQHRPEQLNALTYLLVGGDMLDKNALRRVWSRFPHLHIFNGYGPTENCVFSCMKSLSQADLVRTQLPVGQALDGRGALVLDQHGRIAPIGGLGELLVYGNGLAHGYVAQPDNTADKFTYLDEAQTLRVYRTGDNARLLAQGDFVCLGRSDGQVKIRGHRVELSAIIDAFESLQDILAADVIVTEQGSAKVLVAYIQPNTSVLENWQQALAGWRAQAAEVLPDYMMPQHYLCIEQWPLTANGKVDRNALPVPDLNPASDTPSARPLNAVEQDVAQMWQSLLNIDLSAINAQAHFFLLGGDSLLAMRFVAMLKRERGVSLPLARFLSQPTVAFVAEQLNATNSNAESPLQTHADIALTDKSKTHYPASFAQERMWFLHQLEDSSAAYHIPLVFDVSGELNETALEQALQALVSKHVALHSCVSVQDEEAVKAKVVMRKVPQARIALQRHLFSDIDADPNIDAIAPEAWLLQQTHACTQAHFDLTQDLPIRCDLLVLSPTQSRLILTLHHIACDGWSLSVMSQDVAEFYKAKASSASASLVDSIDANVRFDYDDFSAWQRSEAHQQSLTSQLDYWKSQLKGAPELHQLPVYQARDDVADLRLARWQNILLPQGAERLQQIASHYHLSVSMLLQGLFALSVARASGQQDIITAMPVANREQAQLQSVVGLLVNTLAIRINCDPAQSVRDYLLALKQTHLEALANQDVPFEQVVSECVHSHTLSYPPLAQLLFAYQAEETQSSVSLDEVQLTPLEQTAEEGKFELSCDIIRQNDALTVCFEYAKACFSEAVIADLAASLSSLLHAVCQLTVDAEHHNENESTLLPIGKLGLQDYRAYLQQDNVHSTAIAKTLNIVPNINDIYWHQVALVHDETQLSYKGLLQAVYQLLEQLGHPQGERIAVIAKKGIEQVVSALTCLLSGNTYIPIDPALPDARKDYILQDTAPTWVIYSQPEALNCLNLPAHSQAHYLTLNAQLAGASASVSTETLGKLLQASAALENAPAYIIYTSGSSGQPKGVQVSRQALASHLQGMQQCWPIEVQDKVLQFSSISFDVSIEQLLLAFGAGATCVLSDESHVAKGLDAFLAFLVQANISVADLPPALLLEMTQVQGWDTRLAKGPLRLMFAGGEAMSTALVRAWQDSAMVMKCTLINAYGPTETTITAVAGNATLLDDGLVSLGHVVGARQLAVVNTQGAVMQAGMVGELVIAGNCVADGYIGAAEQRSGFSNLNATPLTESVDAGSSVIQGKCYFTGDRVRLHADGQLTYVGRDDAQVQLHGYRVELGEIETLLAAHEHVQSCKVVVDAQRQSQLNAYVQFKPSMAFDQVAGAGSEANPEHSVFNALQNWLSLRLPEYMVPKQWCAISQWPMTVNDKIDVSALPPISPRTSESDLPKTQVEVALAQLWAQHLGIDASITVSDNFFELGGHSLSAMRLVGRLQQHFAVELHVVDIFTHPTIGALAAFIEGKEQQQTDTAQEPNIQALAEQEGDFPVSFAQYRIWFVEQFATENAQYNMPSAYVVNGKLDVNAVQQALEALVQRHAILRTSYHEQSEVEQGVIQRVHPSVAMPLQQENFSQLSADEQALAIRQYLSKVLHQPVDLTQGSPLSCHLVKLAETRQVLIFNLHHIAGDAWSMQLLERDFVALYLQQIQRASGVEAKASLDLPELAFSYSDYARWQQSLSQSERFITSEQYWVQQLNDAPPFHSLPKRTDAAPVQSVGEVTHSSLNYDEYQALIGKAKQLHITPFMLLQGVFALTVGRYSFTDDVLIGTPMANRNQAQVQNMLGCFINSVCLRQRIEWTQSLEMFCQSLKATHLGAQQHQSYPFEAIVEKVVTVRDLQRSPLFQLFFSFEAREATPQTEASAQPSPALHIEPAPSSWWESVAKYELTLAAVEHEQGCSLSWLYQPDFFDAGFIQSFSDTYINALKAFIYAPQHDAVVKLFTSAAPRMNVGVTDGVGHIHMPFTPVTQTILRQSQSHASTPIYEDESALADYAQLAHFSHQIATQLVAQGVTKGDVVGVYLPRSYQALASFLAVWRIGAVLVPMDVTLPAQRLAHIIQDCQPAAVICQNEPPPHENSCRVVCLSDLSSANDVAEQVSSTAEASLAELQADDLAYILYTSGTTGKPKGVKVPHGALSNLLNSVNSRMRLDDQQRTLWLASIGFDISFFECIGALVRGAPLVIASHSVADEPAQLIALIQHQADMLQMTPSRANLLLELGWQAKANQVVLLAGEALTDAVITPIKDHCLALWNGYGPTEACIYSLLNEVTASMPQSRLALGTEVDNYTHLVCDALGNPLPAGAMGELYIGGVGLAQGYHQLDEQTQSRFVYLAIEEQGAREQEPRRYYRTGDLVRVGEDGLFHYYGRIDKQVKVNGYRIELAEIEEALHAVTGTHAVACVDDSGKSICAYLQAGSFCLSPDWLDNLKASLSQNLPRYMLPARYGLVEKMPSNANGKVDTARLAQVCHWQDELGLIAPRNTIEHSLHHIFCEFLHIDSLSMQDDFFARGGHSVLASRLLARVKELFGTSVSLAAFFNQPNVAFVAAHLEQAPSADLIAQTYMEVYAQHEAAEREVNNNKKEVCGE
ncbi:non-ribosomal peptide synthetase [Alteromonas sp. a30]|uniref:non-ribosomal peptide synthetase n=1 Tax=Alteromonas sp. a30 TaxID=2730917 RepID=UPI00227E730E|nr:non-ribosomal peptide synthetase [Alteromonas sp. a30]MCY7294923.1 amino acid adenylation domain-containing protein [Alteromonas sp. a30]